MKQDLPKILQAHLATKQFDHAYLFLGAKNTQKLAVAEEFIAQLYEQTGWTKEVLEFDFEVSASLDELRELLKKVSLTASGSNKRVVLIKNFEQATPAASSSMLKTLEEPAPSNIFILLANAAQVLPTIMSRCTIVRFTGLAGTQQELTQDEQNGFTNLGRAFQAGLAERVLAVSSLAELSNASLANVISQWLLQQKQQLGTSPLAVVNCRVALETINALQTNRNTKLVLQDFFLKTKI